MKLNWKQNTCALLAGAILFTSVPSTAFAANKPAQNNATTICVENSQELPPVQESDYDSVPEARNAATKVIKTAIKFIKNNKQAAAEVIKKVAGSTVSKNFLKYFDKIVEALDPLLDWTDIPAQAVYDAVRRVLVGAGVSESVAVNIALAIKEGLSWFF